MLYMNTQVNQSVLIGSETSIKVIQINVSRREVIFEVSNPQNDRATINQFAAPLGQSVNISDTVKMRLDKISSNTPITFAVLGFTAPRHIPIKGSWQKDKPENNQKTESQKLADMRDTSLVYYASINGKTPLEMELFKRLRTKVSAEKCVK